MAIDETGNGDGNGDDRRDAADRTMMLGKLKAEDRGEERRAGEEWSGQRAGGG